MLDYKKTIYENNTPLSFLKTTAVIKNIKHSIFCTFTSVSLFYQELSPTYFPHFSKG